KAEQDAQTSRQDEDAEPAAEPDRLAVATPGEGGGRSRSGSHRIVVDENQIPEDEKGISREETLVEGLLRSRREKEAENCELFGPDHVPETGVAGKRPMVDGIAVPFSLNKNATTA